MQRFRSTRTLQKLSSVHAQVHNHFNQGAGASSPGRSTSKARGRIGGVARPCGGASLLAKELVALRVRRSPLL